MNEEQAHAIAESLGGESWQTGGGIWLVLFRRRDGRVAAISGEVVCEYADESSLESGRPDRSILLR